MRRTHTGNLVDDLAGRLPRARATTMMVGLLAVIAGLVAAPPAQAQDRPPGTAAWVDSPAGEGCNANVLARNDDDSTGAVALPFPINFFGIVYDEVYVNNNGNVTFDTSLSEYTPFELTADTPPIIAPFLADVDTSGDGSNEVTYGTTTFGGATAFCVDWEQVGYYSEHADKLNDVQLLIVDRSSASGRSDGDFDIIFNHRTILWETGDASDGTDGFGGTSAGAGYAAGTGADGSFFQMACSLINGACLDTNADTGLARTSTNSTTPGRHVFRIESGGFVHTGGVTGTVVDGGADAVAGALVQACAGSGCRSDETSSTGVYDIPNLPDGDYTVSVWPPGDLRPANADVEVVGGGVTTRDFTLISPTAAPPGTSVGGSEPGQVPTLVVGQPTPMTITPVVGCDPPTFEVRSDGEVREFIQDGHHTTAGVMTLVDGMWTAEFIVEFTGPAEVVVQESGEGCGGDYAFSIYIDPSGFVRTLAGAPIVGASVTLFRGDQPEGPFTVVPDGSVVMDPSNRSNPDVTDDTGHFGWNVAAGYYFVRASAPDCVNPVDPSQEHRDTVVYEIPPPVTDIDLRLDCGDAVDVGGGGSGSSGPARSRYGDGTPTPDEPLHVEVVTPWGSSATIEVVVGEATRTDDGRIELSRSVDISAAPATAASPHQFVFRLHRTLLWSGAQPEDVAVSRDGVVVAPCETGTTAATPDPCVSSRGLDGDAVVVTVRSSRASTWTFLVEPAACDATTDEPFGDVGDDNVHRGAIACVAEHGIAEGTDDGAYEPTGRVSRAQMASFVLRTLQALGVAVPDGPDRFTDDDGGEHEAAIDALAAAGIINGVSETEYAPSATVSRAQTAALLVRAVGFATGEALPPGDDRFGDDDGSVHEEAIDAAAAAGLVEGVSADRFDPDTSVSRQQMASLLTRALDHVIERQLMG